MHIFYLCKLSVTAQRHSIVIALPGKDAEILCNLTLSGDKIVAWLIRYSGPYTVKQLHDGVWHGYNSKGNNLIIENIMMNDDRNETEYQCVTVPSTATERIIDLSDSTILYVAGEYHYSTDIMYVCMYAICSMVLKLSICM